MKSYILIIINPLIECCIVSETSDSIHKPYEYKLYSSSSKYSFVYDPDLSISYLKRSKVKKAPKDLPTPRRLEEMHQRGKNQKRAELHHFRDTQRKRVQLSVLRPITSTPRRLEEMYQKGKNQKRAELHHIRDTKRKRVQLSVLRPINNKILDEKSNRLNELYEKGKKQNRTDLEKVCNKICVC